VKACIIFLLLSDLARCQSQPRIRSGNNDDQNAEWGYFSFSELKKSKLKWLEVDYESEENWPVRKSSEIEKIKV
jgi:hypothetical protein